MRNYAEELAYWYFRLNGFFVLENYVLDRNQQKENKAYETDIIAVRFPYVYEEIGGREDDWHKDLKNMIPKFEENIIGVICEVKSGEDGYSNNDLFIEPKLKRCLQRLGFYKSGSNEFKNAYEQLLNNSSYCYKKCTIVKILISPKRHKGEKFKNILLSDIDSFITERIKKYSEKYSDRNFFNSNLIQYKIWEIKKIMKKVE
ncbi:hypothetical protein [Caldicellulosiruptor acetigenus]|uniref:Uncharacterized protein n=1 Tax=Caldicellulosiruptor acetigenus 6A TaxID=632516 RepID=G2PVY8_9FIRM|nr:hypothetical protein [Caldicellulosiruptor acetigenus]AEM73706.1 hypothetical protein Calla_1073 [Caldicellulosiruptor acetigenus 6A]